jgi:hypothetical protein
MRYESDREASTDVREAFGRVVQDMTPLERARVRERVMSRIAAPSRPLPARRPLVLRTAAAAATFLALALGTSYAIAMSTPGTVFHPVKTTLVRLFDTSTATDLPDSLPPGDSDSESAIPMPDTTPLSPGNPDRSATAGETAGTGELRTETTHLRTRRHSRDADGTQEGRSTGVPAEPASAGDGIGGTRTHSPESGDPSDSGAVGNQGPSPDNNGSGPTNDQPGSTNHQSGPTNDQPGSSGTQGNSNDGSVENRRRSGN